MIAYAFRRFLAIWPVLFAVSIVGFLSFAACPGDPARIGLIMATGNESPSEAAVEAERARLGLGTPLPARYLGWLGRTLQGDLGYSVQTGRAVISELAQATKASAQLAGTAMIITLGLVLLIGAGAALFRGTLLDTAALCWSLFFGSLPDFCIALFGILVLAIHLHWLPVTGYGQPLALVLPALSLALPLSATSARLMRTSMIQAMSGKYLIAARARGVPEYLVVSRHALKNAVAPVLSYLGAQLGFLFGGAAVIETIFTWPGLGRMLVEAVRARDMFVIQGSVLTVAAAYVGINLTVDLLHAVIDPRIRNNV